jgi:hypothetical protein
MSMNNEATKHMKNETMTNFKLTEEQVYNYLETKV